MLKPTRSDAEDKISLFYVHFMLCFAVYSVQILAGSFTTLNSWIIAGDGVSCANSKPQLVSRFGNSTVQCMKYSY